ncbi:unnamed protein product, partial [Staurois parvus]
MTRDCGQHRDDQRLRTVQMTADLWGGGERVPEFDRYPLFRSCSLILPVPRSSRALSSRLLVGVGHDSRVPSAHAQEAVLFVNGKAVPGTHDRSQKPPDQSQSASASRSCALGTRLSCRAP